MTETSQTNKNFVHRIGSFLAVLLTVSIVGIVLWQTYGSGASSSHEEDITTAESSEAPPIFEPPVASIHDLGDGNYRAVAGPMSVSVLSVPKRTFEYRMRIYSLLDEDSRTLTSAIRMLTRDSQAAEFIGATPQQVQEIEAIIPPRIVISDADRQNIERLWARWEHSTDRQKPAAEQELLQALSDLCVRSLEPTRQAYLDAGKKLKEILSLEQLAKLAIYDQRSGPDWTAPMFR